jgi:signal transduction histidine kinase
LLQYLTEFSSNFTPRIPLLIVATLFCLQLALFVLVKKRISELGGHRGSGEYVTFSCIVKVCQTRSALLLTLAFSLFVRIVATIYLVAQCYQQIKAIDFLVEQVWASGFVLAVFIHFCLSLISNWSFALIAKRGIHAHLVQFHIPFAVGLGSFIYLITLGNLSPIFKVLSLTLLCLIFGTFANIVHAQISSHLKDKVDPKLRTSWLNAAVLISMAIYSLLSAIALIFDLNGPTVMISAMGLLAIFTFIANVLNQSSEPRTFPHLEGFLKVSIFYLFISTFALTGMIEAFVIKNIEMSATQQVFCTFFLTIGNGLVFVFFVFKVLKVLVSRLRVDLGSVKEFLVSGKRLNPDEFVIAETVELATECRRISDDQKDQTCHDSILRLMQKIAHELRTPYDMIATLLKSLELKGHDVASLSSEIRHYSEKVNRLVSEVLLLDRASILKKSACSFKEIVDWSIKENAPLLKRKNIILDAEYPDLELGGDFHKLVCLFSNLIKNAIEAENPGAAIAIKGELKNAAIELAVANRGAVIAIEKQNQIFLPFVSGKNTGTGLGLAIAKNIAELHSGSIFCSSSVELGTKFTVVLPI